MSKKKIALIFLAGVICGIVVLPAGAYLWFSLRTWLPYTQPDRAIVERIEKIAVARMAGFTDKTLRLDRYRRWYVQGKEDGRNVIWGEWDTAGSPGLYLGHRRFPPNSNMVLGGGCGWVHLRYDLSRERLDQFWCNAPM